MTSCETTTKAWRRAKVKRLAEAYGVNVADAAVCRGHSAPLDFLACWLYDQPPLSLVCGPRGGGKSFIAGFATHVDSVRFDRLGTKILGGSLAQSQQIYSAIADFDRAHPGHLTHFGKEAATYLTGSYVSILAASPKSVRGPHVPRLRLDEVDEIPDDLRESAMGMSMSKHGVRGCVSFTSTWHRVGGPMTALMERGEAGEFPTFRFCLFEVLERCPEERSGPALEHCPACPLVKWCHDGGAVPRAKRSSGHYAIDSACQKVLATSARVFEADYLCTGPKAEGLWFPAFSPATHVRETAEYDPALPVNLAFDSGVFTGAVFWQLGTGPDGEPEVRVFADYLSEGATAEHNARQLLEVARTRCNGRIDRVATDPAGNARNAVGPTVLMEYQRAGLKPLRTWPVGSISDSLALLDSFITPADSKARLTVHPRCTATTNALRSYRRAKRAGQWQDYPEDPQHPAEDMVDALRGGLREMFPAGRKPPSKLPRVPVGRVGY